MNFLFGTFSGLFISGSIVGSYISYPYTKKILEESKTQNFPTKILSYYGATMTTTGMSIGYGFAFALSPIIIPSILMNKQNSYLVDTKMDPIDIISISK